MNKKNLLLYAFVLAFVLNGQASAQKVNDFPAKTDPLHKRVALFDKLMFGNHWNEGTLLQRVIFPPAGFKEPVIAWYSDCFDVTVEMLAAYCFKYAITENRDDLHIANQLFEGLLKLEKVTGVPGLMARGFYKTDKPLWHEQVLWYPMEWHWSTSMPGYRWLGDLSADKFTSLFYGIGIYWELCADEENKQRAADLLDRFMSRCIYHNFKLVDLDGKMTLWGNFCPDLQHQELNSLEMLMGLKVTHRITGKERFHAAYNMLIDRYHYDDRQLKSKVMWPPEWRNPYDDDHAAKSLYMLMRYEKDRSLLIKYRMNLNIHWHDWQNHDFSFPGDPWLIMLYQVLTGENVLTEQKIDGIKNMWGFDRETREFKIPTENGHKVVKSVVEGHASTMIRNYWFGRYYGFIDPSW
ncbi:MAG: hypothetical protein DWQ10_17785 [Calditrichaeota bacterium]|nr:MAG: hypothetical protein DWQ10_17785 [Calditrichota bacterium]